MRSGADLLAWLASMPAAERDSALERMLDVRATSSASPGPHLVGHHLTSVAAIVRAIYEVPVQADDVVLDLGAGVGKLGALVHLLTGATVRGVEIQPELVARAVPIANVTHGDARSGSLDADVVLLYCPFEGPVLDEVSKRLDALDVIVCALGVELRCERLRKRPSADFWMTIWEPPVERRESRTPLPMPALAQRIAHERDDG